MNTQVAIYIPENHNYSYITCTKYNINILHYPLTFLSVVHRLVVCTIAYTESPSLHTHTHTHTHTHCTCIWQEAQQS